MFHGKIIEEEASVERSSLKEPAWKFSKLTTYAKYEFSRGCFSRNFPKIFKHIWQDTSVEGYYNHCFTYITDNKNMAKPTFRPRGKPDTWTICSHNKNAKTYWKTNAQRGWVSDLLSELQFKLRNNKFFSQEKSLNRTLMCKFYPG